MSSKKATVQIACTCLFILACALFVQAQSGRRQPRVEPAAPVPTPTPEPTPTPKKEKKDAELFLFVGMDRNGTFNNYPLSFYDAALAGCVEELRKNTSASVDASSRDLNRGEAVRKAKSDSKTYVVYLQLRNPALGTSSNRSDEIELEYIVFAPTTAKMVVSGTAYQNARRAGPVVIGPPGSGSSNIVFRQEMLKRAGEDAAERIIKSLHLSDPKIN